MADPRPVPTVHLGWAEVTNLVQLETHRAIGMSEDKATIRLPIEELRSPGVSFAGEVQIAATFNGRVHPLFTGLVDAVRLGDDGNACIELVGLHRDLETSLVGGLVVGAGTSGSELIYSLLCQAGWPEDRIKLDGWIPGPSEPFIVAAPVVGLSLSNPRQVGEVIFTNVIPVTVDLGADNPLVAEFEKASSWASVTVEARTLVEAERAAVAKLSAALSELRAFAFYSYPVLDGAVRSFEWRRTQARPRLLLLTYVGAIASTRRWLRDRLDGSKLETLDLDGLELPMRAEQGAGVASKRKLDRALVEWHLSVDASTEIARLAHLWRALECYVAGVPTNGEDAATLFSKEELTLAKESLRSAKLWSEEQLLRLQEFVGRMNEPPLLKRLRTTLKADGIELVEAEFDALIATRSMRNDLEHGGSLSPTQHRALDLAAAIANKIVVEAVLKYRRSG